jgi:hypothetical protein
VSLTLTGTDNRATNTTGIDQRARNAFTVVGYACTDKIRAGQRRVFLRFMMRQSEERREMSVSAGLTNDAQRKGERT